MTRVLNAFMLHGKSLDVICRIAKRTGCASVTLEISHLDEDIDRLLKTWGLTAFCAGTLFLTVESLEQSCQAVRELLKKARAVGIPLVSAVLQSALPIGEARSIAQAELCRRLAGLGAQYGVCICVEPLHRSCDWLSSLTDLQELQRLCENADPRWFGWILDVCHCEDPCGLPLQKLVPYLRSVHLADVCGSDPNIRCFPGEGRLPLFRWFSLLRESGYQGPVELEVLSPELEQLNESELVRKIDRAFLPSGFCFLVGELALHRHMSQNGLCLKEAVGGSAGMVAFQLRALGVQPVLAGICGDDSAGGWIAKQADLVSLEVIRQKGRASSLVEIDAGASDRLAVRPGNIDVSLLKPMLARLPDGFAYVYLPCFPGYEELAKAAEGKTGWNILYDFGFHAWCGNVNQLYTAIVERTGFCALINGKNLGCAEKRRLGEACILRGYTYAIITDGVSPLLLFEKNRYVSFPVDEVLAVDTCGAGDCLAAGIIAGLSNGLAMEEAVRYGMDTARQKVQVYGIPEKEVRCD